MDAKIQQELLDKTSNFLQQASKQLGATAAHVYQVVVWQQFVIGVSELANIVVGTLLIIIPAILYFKYVTKNWSKWDDGQFAAVMIGIFGGIVYIFAVVITMTTLVDGLQHLLNPEYFAIQFIFNAATGHGN